MKRLYIVRHAKSDWGNAQVADFDRPLNQRGRQDAPRMAELLKSKYVPPDLILSSPAKRSSETAAYFNTAFPLSQLLHDPSLYHADIDEIINGIVHLDGAISSVMVVCHNPGITYFANVICDANIDNVPTCGTLVIDADTDNWENLDMSQLKLVDFLYPKM
ncbi:MAG: histidine phosphatase family protein [Saprospiraceae bacterium]|nr:histidine phosphatase family protein [Saprospiraceae bacterium]